MAAWVAGGPKYLPGRAIPVVVCWLLNIPATCECISGTAIPVAYASTL